MQLISYLLIISVLIVSGCTHLNMSSDYSGPETPTIGLLEPFHYPELKNAPSVGLIEKKERYSVFKVGFNAEAGPGPLWEPFYAEFYRPEGEGRFPVVLLLPILKGKEKIIQGFARYYVKKGYAALIIQRQKSFRRLKTFEGVNAILHQAVINHKIVLDWLEKQPEIDRERIAVLGLSMGGIKATLLSGADHRIKATVIVIAAGDLPWVLTNTREHGLVKKRKRHLETFRISSATLYDTLCRELTFDPLVYAPYIDAKTTLMVLARFDRVAHYRKGLELKEAIGNPETIVIPTGHYTSVLFKDYVMRKSFRFIDRHLSKKEG